MHILPWTSCIPLTSGVSAVIRSALADGAGVTVHMYDTGHAFANSGRADKFDKAATEMAHKRTFELLDGLK